MNNYRFGFFFTAVAAVGFSVIFLLEPSVIIDGLRKGLNICGSSVIPSLFPFIVLSDFVVRSDFSSIIGQKLSPFTEKFFRLPGSAGCAVIMSLIGGFPIGAKMTAQLYENGEITQAQGKRMLLFCVNAGPAFVVGTVGAVMLSSRKAGIILLASLTFTSLTAGFVSCFFTEKEAPNKTEIKTLFNPNVLSESVSSSVQTMFNICAWIMLFSGLNALIIRLPLSETSEIWLTVLSEVTNGCMSVSGHFPACILALVLGWSGLAVHCQIMPYLSKLNMKLRYFWISRIIIGGVSAAVSYLFFRLFPCEISVFADSAQIVSKPYSVSVPAAAAMMLLSALLLIDIKPCAEEKNVI